MARLLYISQCYSTHDRRFLERFIRADGIKVWFLPCTHPPFTYEERSLPAGVEQLPPLLEGSSKGPLRDALVAVPRLQSWIKKIKPDLVHAGPIQSGGFFAALAGCSPLLIMSWGSDILSAPQKSFWTHWVTRFSLRRAQLCLADCRAAQEKMRSLSGLPAERVVSLPYGIEVQNRPQAPDLGIRKRLGWQDNPVLISVRSLEASHGTHILLSAIEQLLPKMPEVRVLILGGGSMRGFMEERLRSRSLGSQIHFEGQVREDLLPSYLKEADLYVSAALSDGTSVSLLEAMAAGLPVIVTDEPGNQEWVERGVHGWLTPAGDPQALAKTIMEGLRLPAQERARIAELNRKQVLERADLTRNFERLTQAYGGLMHA